MYHKSPKTLLLYIHLSHAMVHQPALPLPKSALYHLILLQPFVCINVDEIFILPIGQPVIYNNIYLLNNIHPFWCMDTVLEIEPI